MMCDDKQHTLVLVLSVWVGSVDHSTVAKISSISGDAHAPARRLFTSTSLSLGPALILSILSPAMSLGKV